MIEAQTHFGRSPSRGRKLDAVWLAMLETPAGDYFTAAAIAASCSASPRFVRSYCAVLEANGYLVKRPGYSWNPDPTPRRYQVGKLYREAIAPQLAGGSGSGNALGKGWRNLKEVPPPAPARPARAKRPPDRKSLARSKRRRAAAAAKNRKGKARK